MPPSTVQEHLQQAQQLIQQGLFGKALATLNAVLSTNAQLVPAIRLRGFALIGLKNYSAALACYQQLLAINAQDTDALIKCGHIFMFARQPQKALNHFNAALKINPDDPVANALCANALNVLKQPQLAAQHYAHSLSIAPNNIPALINYGCVLYDLNEYEQALKCFEKILSMNPDHLLARSYRAFCLMSFNRHEEAMVDYEKALAINPQHPITLFNQSLCLLLMGDFKNGWQKHEWRWQTEMQHVNRQFSQPLWLGKEDLKDRSILLYAEQGIGDTIHFMRYIPMVAALGARIIVEVQRELIELIRGTPGVEKFIAQGEKLPITDYRCPLMSLPLAFGTELDTIPVNIPYVFSDKTLVAQWQQRLSRLTKPYKVGIAWSGNPLNKTNRRRSIPLPTLLSICTDNIDFISLQKRITPDELILLNTHDIPAFSEELTDFNQTAALIECLDLVITTDTSVAHIAAAMGKPTWVLLAFSADWRWLLNRKDNPWYPTITLFRQHAMWNWSQVVDEVKQNLLALGKMH